MENVVNKIQTLLNVKGVYADVYACDGEIRVDITWGDWKHQHRYADYLIETLYPEAEIKTYVTECDDSDCYSAIHCVTNVA